MVCRRYRPRQPRSSPVWQVFKQHWSDYLLRHQAQISANHGPRATQVSSAVAAFLRCGDLHAGFPRLCKLWCHAVLRRLHRAGILANWQTEHLLS